MASFSIPPKERAARRIGSVLAGKYEIERVIGSGGMATVYLGVHRNGRRVAVKLLHEELGIHREMRARFVREGYVANAVGHPGAVLVFDDDEGEDGAAFLVMELLLGETLSDRCKRRGGKLPCKEALALAHQLLDVLAAAHEKGIVHRDIKPENLFLTTTGQLKVLDFGVARMQDDSAGSLATVTGARIGTPAYMPPEQALGRTHEVDARTDLWAVGATLFSMLAGRTVHTANSAAEVIVIAATTPPRSLGEIAPDVPAPVVAVVDRAVQFTREARFPDARAMQQALCDACQEAFGEPLDPLATGPAPESQLGIAPVQDDKETLSIPGRARAQATTTPATFDVGGGLSGAEDAPSTKKIGRRDRTGSPSGNLDLPAADTRPSHPVGDARPSHPVEDARPSHPVGDTRPSHPVAVSRSELPSKTDPTLSPATLKPRKSGAPEGPGESLAPPPPADRRRRWWPVAAALTMAATIGATYGVTHWIEKPNSASSSPAVSASASAAAPRECQKNIDCRAKGEAICRKDDGVCVPLATDLCKVLASPGDIENDATVWIGAMYPVSEPDTTSYGPKARDAVELARRDFAEVSGGLPPVRPGAPRRPIGVVLCDDRKSPEPSAEHLVRDLRVPAVLGFALSKEVMDLASTLFLPSGVLALASNTSSILRDVPRVKGEPRLVYRVTTSTEMVDYPAALLTGVAERDIRASGEVAPSEPLRMAIVRVANLSGQSTADSFVKYMRFNEKSVAENGDLSRQFSVAERTDYQMQLDPAQLQQLIAFAPHVVAFAASGVSPSVQIERAWPRTARFRPRYIEPSGDMRPDFRAHLVSDPALRRRVYMVDINPTAEPLIKFVHHHNEVYPHPITAPNATCAPYDAFYVFAYAAASLGEQPITGKALAAAIPRLLPPGEPLDVGPGAIYKAFHALSTGKNIDLQGAATTLDFDLDTGDASVDMAYLCITPGPTPERVDLVPSGLVFRAREKKLQGTMRCP